MGSACANPIRKHAATAFPNCRYMADGYRAPYAINSDITTPSATSGRNRNARLALLPRRRWLDLDTRRRLRAGFTSLRDIADLIVEGEL